MFKKFDSEGLDQRPHINQLKSSHQRTIRAKLIEAFPNFEEHLGVIWPKKVNMKQMKCIDRIELICTDAGEALFFRLRDGDIVPTLKLLHKYPNILPIVQVDKGAIKFVLSGAHIMCPGLTSAGAHIPVALAKNTIVAVHAEGKCNALAIGICKMSTDDIKSINKGIGVDNLHFLGDGLWRMKEPPTD